MRRFVAVHTPTKITHIIRPVATPLDAVRELHCLIAADKTADASTALVRGWRIMEIIWC